MFLVFFLILSERYGRLARRNLLSIALSVILLVGLAIWYELKFGGGERRTRRTHPSLSDASQPSVASTGSTGSTNSTGGISGSTTTSTPVITPFPPGNLCTGCLKTGGPAFYWGDGTGNLFKATLCSSPTATSISSLLGTGTAANLTFSVDTSAITCSDLGTAVNLQSPFSAYVIDVQANTMYPLIVGNPQNSSSACPHPVTVTLNSALAISSYCSTPSSTSTTQPTYGANLNCSGCPSGSMLYGAGDGSVHVAQICSNSTSSIMAFTYDSSSTVSTACLQQLAAALASPLINLTGSRFLVSSNGDLYAQTPALNCTLPLGFVCSGVQKGPSTQVVACLSPTTIASQVTGFCSEAYPPVYPQSSACSGCPANSLLYSQDGVTAYAVQVCPYQGTNTTPLNASSVLNGLSALPSSVYIYYDSSSVQSCQPAQYVPPPGAAFSVTSPYLINGVNLYLQQSTCSTTITPNGCLGTTQNSSTITVACINTSTSLLDQSNFCSPPSTTAALTLSPLNLCKGCPSASGTLLYGDGTGKLFNAYLCSALGASLSSILTSGSAVSPVFVYFVVDGEQICQDANSLTSGTPYLIDVASNTKHTDQNTSTCILPGGTICNTRPGQSIKCALLSTVSSFLLTNYCSVPSSFLSGNCAGCPTTQPFLYSDGNSGAMYPASLLAGSTIPDPSLLVQQDVNFVIDKSKSSTCTLNGSIISLGRPFILDNINNRVYPDATINGLCVPNVSPSILSAATSASSTLFVTCLNIGNLFYLPDYCALSGLIPNYQTCGTCNIPTGKFLWKTNGSQLTPVNACLPSVTSTLATGNSIYFYTEEAAQDQSCVVTDLLGTNPSVFSSGLSTDQFLVNYNQSLPSPTNAVYKGSQCSTNPSNPLSVCNNLPKSGILHCLTYTNTTTSSYCPSTSLSAALSNTLGSTNGVTTSLLNIATSLTSGLAGALTGVLGNGKAISKLDWKQNDY